MHQFANILFYFLVFATICFSFRETRKFRNLSEIIHSCHLRDRYIDACLTYSANRLAVQFRRGIPELEIMDVEPVVIDEIYLSLSSNPDGYRSMLRNIQAYHVSKLTVTAVSIDLQTSRIQLNLKIPRISVVAKYRSSGVLIMIRSSGGGDYWGEYKEVQAEVCLKVNFVLNNGVKYLQLEDLEMDFNVKNIQMGVKNILHGGIIRETALNLFLNTCSQLLLREMKPAIKKKLTVKIKRFIDKLFKKIPYQLLVVD